MLSQKDIIVFESLNYFEEQERREREVMEELDRLYENKGYEKFKKDMLQYGDFTEEELQEMWESEMLVEHDLQEVTKMKTLKRNISYNFACAILEAHKYGVTDTKSVGDWVIFYKNGDKVARYNENRGILQVR